MSILLIDNENNNSHLEIIESIIIKYPFIIGYNYNEIKVHLNLKKDIDFSFIDYIKYKYPFIKFENVIEYDFRIFISFYPKKKEILEISNPKKDFFISHRTFNSSKYPNVFFLTPLSIKNYISAEYLPFTEYKKKIVDIPIFLIQGNYSNSRRDYSLLEYILNHKFEYNYKIKLLGRGEIPEIVKKHLDKFIICQNLNFKDYHLEILDCFSIITLISKKQNKKYYVNSLTSSINYAKAYNLKCILDKELQLIYKLNNVEIYTEDKEIVNSFNRCLKYFNTKQKKRLNEIK